MNYFPSKKDILLLSQHEKLIHVRVLLLNSCFTEIEELGGSLRSLSLDINADSDVRRTGSIEIDPDFNGYELTAQSKLWMDHYIRIFLDFQYLPTDETLSYSIGTFIVDTQSFTYDSAADSLTINLVDLTAKLDGTHGSELGAETLEMEEGSSIREHLAALVQSGMAYDHLYDSSAPPYHQYIIEEPEIRLPYTIETDDGCTVLDLIVKLRDLTPGYETFFDARGIFHYQPVPSCKEDPFILQADNFENDITVYSESREYNYAGIFNVVQVYGKIYDDIDRYIQEGDSSFNENCLNVTLEKFGAYSDYSFFAIEMPQDNPADMSININSLGKIPVYLDNNEDLLPPGKLKKGEIYIFMYLSGHFLFFSGFQASGIAVLLSWDPDEELIQKYRSDYACNSITFVIEPDNPFTVDRIGRRYKRLNGNEYENIQTETEALDTVEYYLWQSARVTNTITISCDIIPFLDVNQKFEYRPQKADAPFQYITKQISLSISETDAQMTITACLFNESHPDIITPRGRKNISSRKDQNHVYPENR